MESLQGIALVMGLRELTKLIMNHLTTFQHKHTLLREAMVFLWVQIGAGKAPF